MGENVVVSKQRKEGLGLNWGWQSKSDKRSINPYKQEAIRLDRRGGEDHGKLRFISVLIPVTWPRPYTPGTPDRGRNKKPVGRRIVLSSDTQNSRNPYHALNKKKKIEGEEIKQGEPRITDPVERNEFVRAGCASCVWWFHFFFQTFDTWSLFFSLFHSTRHGGPRTYLQAIPTFKVHRVYNSIDFFFRNFYSRVDTSSPTEYKNQ